MVDRLTKLKWCFGKNEVKFIEPNENLAKEYLKSAEETLLVLKNEKKYWCCKECCKILC